MLDRLRSHARELIRLAAEGDIARFKAAAAEAAYNLAIAEECAQLGLPPGYAIDVFGDGRVKPKEQCKFMPDPPTGPEK